MSEEDYEQGFLEGYDQGLSTNKEKSFLILAARIDELKKEILRLRAELAAVTKERDRMREALKPLAKAIKGQIADILFGEMPGGIPLEHVMFLSVFNASV